MNRLIRTLLIAAALPMLLTACASGPAIREDEDVRETIAPACPTPTPAAKRAVIIRELDAAIAAGVPPNVLAVEWERINDGARVCRGAKR